MSDALCGPSNALQNFQKHTSVDRTLQQDRLTSRQPSAQGFRSQSPRDGILDPEFAAFEANLGGPVALPDLQHQAHFGAPAQAPVAAHESSGWASDFQNLHISGPATASLQGPSIGPAQAGWHNEFLSQQQHMQASHVQAPQVANRAFQPAFAPSFPMYNTTAMSTHQLPQQIPSEHVAPTEQFDESAFEAAFEQARADMELQGAEATVDVQPQTHDEPSQSDLVEPVHETIRIGSDTIPQTDKQDPLVQNRDADALAQTAGQLLDSVRHDQSQKFQQSNFLALMRRIRDREVEVEGDEFRETAQSLHPGGRYYPGQPRGPIIPPDSTSKDPAMSTLAAGSSAVEEAST
ncbi:hypothetical protein N7462_006387 [Penicillium macrosclerotiorum]|uniref:uncharacterized protein n=1 Tax=Penicillium macrosclerotiorum TaxID=303699 RepID=UPI002548CB2E|nr:uncharacterized protein N7462_006387 [Penicillium macrosclerotiorum]KAJ5683222.1 hypothetical protein N7462_006387 [Penicillium macrosclerotiorum]